VNQPVVSDSVPMDALGIGDRVTLDGRVYVVRGISPMSAALPRVWLEDIETHEHIETTLDGIERVSRSARQDAAPAQTDPPPHA